MNDGFSSATVIAGVRRDPSTGEKFNKRLRVNELGDLMGTPYGVVGDSSICVLNAKIAAPGTNDVLTSVSGFKMIEAMVAGVVAPGTGDAFSEAVAIAISTTANDVAGVAALLATALAEFDGTPSTPPVLVPNARILRTQDDIASFIWDGSTTIKTVGVRAVGAAPNQVNTLLNVVE